MGEDLINKLLNEDILKKSLSTIIELTSISRPLKTDLEKRIDEMDNTNIDISYPHVEKLFSESRFIKDEVKISFIAILKQLKNIIMGDETPIETPEKKVETPEKKVIKVAIKETPIINKDDDNDVGELYTKGLFRTNKLKKYDVIKTKDINFGTNKIPHWAVVWKVIDGLAYCLVITSKETYGRIPIKRSRFFGGIGYFVPTFAVIPEDKATDKLFCIFDTRKEVDDAVKEIQKLLLV